VGEGRRVIYDVHYLLPTLVHAPLDWDYIIHFLSEQGVREAIGMPISVQVVGLPFHDELVLKGMKEVESVSPFHPKT
jgi:hypothetical protein